MLPIKVWIKHQEIGNLTAMSQIIRGQVKEYKISTIGFLDWRYVCSSLHRKKLQWINNDGYVDFEVYEIESMIYMIKHLSQQKNNEMLFLKFVDSLQKFVIEPFGEFKAINDWYNAHEYFKSTLGNTEFKDLPEMYQDYLQEKYAQSKETKPT